MVERNCKVELRPQAKWTAAWILGCTLIFPRSICVSYFTQTESKWTREMFFPGTLTQISILHPPSSAASGEDIMGRDRSFSSAVGEQKEKKKPPLFSVPAWCFFFFKDWRWTVLSYLPKWHYCLLLIPQMDLRAVDSQPVDHEDQ